jgi:endonuclease/exonuclease/phosphatase family metal-dependent hydrolase
MKKALKILLKVVLSLVSAAVAFVVLLFLFLTIREYRPDEKETLKTAFEGQDMLKPSVGDELTVVTWNVGCGTLGDNADFFMDYGEMVYTADKDRVKQNLSGITDTLTGIDPDIMLLQETDLDASRSYHTDETEVISDAFPGFDYSFAYNFKVDIVPYPIPPIGHVESGIMTLSRYDITSAERISLPCPFKWPIRVANLKRCVSVNRIPIEGSDKELVIVNLHLEAYDSGEGKIAQTKMLADILKAEVDAGNYVIAAGDFNQAFSGTDISAYPEYPGKWHCGLLDENAFDDSLIFLQDPSAPTCRSLDQPYATAADKEHFQFYVIDGFIVSDNLEVQSVETLDCQFENTDHNPVVIKVIIGE